ncbi:hypothetical protein [Chitinophaga sp. YR627]|uniref:hypothetical protein n=1 Tax=Chitinophaga sp. YR627 TaxID=1881041 RepID=UPI001160C4BF|nr:hypothetical protein [Chitinophaga sp. YR627]
MQDRSWKLELQKDSVYVMEAEGFGGKRSQRDPLLRTTGAYKVNGDTLRLVPRGTHYQYAYLIKQGKLLAINPYSETIRGYTYTVTFFE